MAFEPGNKKPANSGMKKGQFLKKNQEIQDMAAELGCNPAKILMLIAMGDAFSLNRTEVIDLDKRKEAAKELMPYLYGKRKPIDSEGNDKTDIISEILEAIDGNK